MTTKGPPRRYYVRFQDGTFRAVTASSKQDACNSFMKTYRPPKGSYIWIRPQVPAGNETGEWQQFRIPSGPATLEESNLVRRPRRDSAAAQAQAPSPGRRVGHARGVMQGQPAPQVYPQPQIVLQLPGYPPNYPQMQTPLGPPPSIPESIDMSRRVGHARGGGSGVGDYRASAPTIPPPLAAPPIPGPPPAAPTPASEAPIGPQYGPVYPALTLPYSQEQLAQIISEVRAARGGKVELSEQELTKIVEAAVKATLQSLKRRR